MVWYRMQYADYLIFQFGHMLFITGLSLSRLACGFLQ